MNYWLHRISHLAELSYPLLEKGYLTIGFSDFSDELTINNVENNNENEMKDIYRRYISLNREVIHC